MICALEIKKDHPPVKMSESGTVQIMTSGGVGYIVSMAAKIDMANDINHLHIIHIYHNITERGQSLFGFIDTQSRSLFIDLLTVQGVGPSVACKLLQKCDYLNVRKYIANNDTDALIKSKGVGKKTAEKIVSELTDKYDYYKDTEEEIVSKNIDSQVLTKDTEARKLAIAGLAKLGYKGNKVTEVMKTIPVAVHNSELGKLAADVTIEDLSSIYLQEAFKLLRQG